MEMQHLGDEKKVCATLGYTNTVQGSRGLLGQGFLKNIPISSLAQEASSPVEENLILQILGTASAMRKTRANT